MKISKKTEAKIEGKSEASQSGSVRGMLLKNGLGMNSERRSKLLAALFGLSLGLTCIGLSPAVLAQDFVRAVAPYQWTFPRDHGQHSNYETEWWYYTGQLYEQDATFFKDKPRLGFQLTFFRKATWTVRGLSQDYMVHAAVTDLRDGKTIFESRLGGGELGLSGVSTASLRSWSGDWSVDPIGDDIILRFSVEERETRIIRSLRLKISGAPHPWLQGIAGLSKKSECPGCASMYYTLPKLDIKAQYIRGESEEVLRGLGWMDHEFMTNSLGPDQAGWDWMGLMLKDGRSVMVFRLRSDRSDLPEYLAGGVNSRGSTRLLSRDDFSLTPVAVWTSPRSKATYPVSWRISIPSERIDTVVSARVRDSEIGSSVSDSKQEAGHGVTYWEGPVASSDESVLGYLEMTGYAGKLSF